MGWAPIFYAKRRHGLAACFFVAYLCTDLSIHRGTFLTLGDPMRNVYSWISTSSTSLSGSIEQYPNQAMLRIAGFLVVESWWKRFVPATEERCPGSCKISTWPSQAPSLSQPWYCSRSCNNGIKHDHHQQLRRQQRRQQRQHSERAQPTNNENKSSRSLATQNDYGSPPATAPATAAAVAASDINNDDNYGTVTIMIRTTTARAKRPPPSRWPL